MDPRKILSFLTIPIGKPVETFFVNKSKDILKPRVNTQPPDKWYLSRLRNEIRTIEEIEIISDGRRMVAHKLELVKNNPNITITNSKKAIVYIPGNCPEISDSLPDMEPLLLDILKNIQSANLNTDVACYCQHYRGRGSNQASNQENFNDYTQLQDAKDQAVLIKKLVDEGFQPKDILLLGYSYGSAVLISTVYYLIKTYGYRFSDLKCLSDRGYGNLFDFRLLKPIIYDPETAQKRLHEKGMLPELPLHDIVKHYMPESLIFYVDNDWCIWTDFSLANTFKENELPGRIMRGEAKHYANSHFANRAYIGLKTIPEIKPHHFMTAMLLETSIVLQASTTFTKPFAGYALTSNAQHGDENFVDFPHRNFELKEPEYSNLFVTTAAMTNLLEELHKYCLNHAARAAASGDGASYNRAWMSSTGLIGWTAKQQIQMAIQLMTFLYNVNEETIKQLKALEQQSGPHLSGELYPIFTRVIAFANEYQQIQHFNSWVSSMQNRRQERIEKDWMAEQDLLNGWEAIEETNTSPQEIDADATQSYSPTFR